MSGANEDKLDSLVRCKFCDDETKLKHGCKKQRWSVCEKHFMVTCPECGHEAFWMEKPNGEGRFCCFAVQPWCSWVSDSPPNATSETEETKGDLNELRKHKM